MEVARHDGKLYSVSNRQLRVNSMLLRSVRLAQVAFHSTDSSLELLDDLPAERSLGRTWNGAVEVAFINAVVDNRSLSTSGGKFDAVMELRAAMAEAGLVASRAGRVSGARFQCATCSAEDLPRRCHRQCAVGH